MSDYYSVEKILDKRIHKGKVQYKIKWEGYSTDECTWEPLAHLDNVKYMIKEYEQEQNEFLNKKRHNNTNTEEPLSSPTKPVNTSPQLPTTSSSLILNEQPQPHTQIKYLRVLSVTRELKAIVEIEENKEISKIKVSTKQLRELCPIILLDYYETRLKFSDK
jgi:hypothetical protein